MFLAQFVAAAMIAPAVPAAFDQPLSDLDLAVLSAATQARPSDALLTPALLGSNMQLSREQEDAWWANDGLTMIANAKRPTAVVPSFLNLSGLRNGQFSIRFNGSVSSSTSH